MAYSMLYTWLKDGPVSMFSNNIDENNPCEALVLARVLYILLSLEVVNELPSTNYKKDQFYSLMHVHRP